MFCVVFIVVVVLVYLVAKRQEKVLISWSVTIQSIGQIFKEKGPTEDFTDQ